MVLNPFLETGTYFREHFEEKESAFEFQLYFSCSKIWTLNMTSKIQFMPMSKYFCESYENTDNSWREQFLVPLPLYHPVFTIVIHG